MKHFENLRSLISRLVAQSCSERELACLIQLSINVGKAIIRRCFQRKFIVMERAGYSHEDCAVLAIEDLFVARHGVRAWELVQYMRKYIQAQSDLSSEELLIALRKLIYRKVHQTMVQIAGEVDPAYRKVLRNITDLVKKDETFQSREYFNDILVHRTSGSHSLDLHKPEMPGDEALEELTSHAWTDMSTAELVGVLLQRAETSGCYRRAISKTTLATVLRDYYLVYNRFESTTTQDPHSFELRDAMDRTINSMQRGLLRKDLAKSGDRAVESYCRAIKSMLEDITQQHARRLYDYYLEHFPPIPYDEYRQNGRNRFEYVMHQAREHFYSECRHLLKNDP